MESDVMLAHLMAVLGEQMNLRIDGAYSRILRGHSPSAAFFAAVAHSLTWTGHAVRDDDFIGRAIRFLDGGTREHLKKATEYGARFGKDGLSQALEAWRTLINNSSDLPDIDADAARLESTQDKMYRVAVRLRRRREILGIGAWLFCAPFKIVAIHNRNAWSDPELDGVLMPLGLEVVRGMRKLVRSKSKWVDGIDLNMLGEEEGDLAEGMATVYLVQDCTKKIALDSGSNVVHINSGLFLHGRSGIDKAAEELEKMSG